MGQIGTIGAKGDQKGTSGTKIQVNSVKGGIACLRPWQRLRTLEVEREEEEEEEEEELPK